MEYELLFFTSVANEGEVETIKKEIGEILESLGAKILGEWNDIGKRKLAYPIKRNTHAFFSFVRFALDDEKKQNIPEIGKRLGLYNKVMRHIIVRASEIGKPLVSGEMKFGKREAARKPIKQKEESVLPFQVPKTADLEKERKLEDKKTKASLSELDEKLSEILEETPE